MDVLPRHISYYYLCYLILLIALYVALSVLYFLGCAKLFLLFFRLCIK